MVLTAAMQARDTNSKSRENALAFKTDVYYAQIRFIDKGCAIKGLVVY